MRNGINPIRWLYFDKKSLAMQVLETKKYAPYIKFKTQDRYIVRLLKDQGKSALESKEIWKEIAAPRWETDVSEDLDGLFWILWGSVSRVRWNEPSECDIYQEDIDAINACELKSTLEKRILLCFLAQVRLKGIYRLNSADFRSCAKLAGKGSNYITGSKPRKLLDTMVEMGWLATESRDEEFDYDSLDDFDDEDDDEFYMIGLDGEDDDDELPQFDEYDAVEVQDDSFDYWKVTIPEGKTVIATLKSTYEVVGLFDLIHCEKVCPECGSVFESGGCSQTCLCPDCQEKKRREDIRNAARICMQDSREGTQIGITTRVCEKCGMEFDAGARCQRKLCDKCYKLHIREVDRLRKQKI